MQTKSNFFSLCITLPTEKTHTDNKTETFITVCYGTAKKLCFMLCFNISSVSIFRGNIPYAYLRVTDVNALYSRHKMYMYKVCSSKNNKKQKHCVLTEYGHRDYPIYKF